MLSFLIAERYAKALLAAAKHFSQVDIVQQEAKALALALETDKNLQLYLDQPLSSPAEKWKAFSSALSGRFSKVSMQFLKVVFENKREAYLLPIFRQFQTLVDEQEGRVKAEITTALAVDSAKLQLLSQVLSNKFKRKVDLVPVVDRGMLGGVRLRMGDTIYDASLDGQLQRLEDRLGQDPKLRRARQAKKGSLAKRVKAKLAQKKNIKKSLNLKKKNAPKKKTQE